MDRVGIEISPRIHVAGLNPARKYHSLMAPADGGSKVIA